MRTRLLTASITALTLAGTLSLNAQTPSTPQQMRPQTQPPATRPMTDDRQPPTTTKADRTVTVTGCLKEEKDVPGRRESTAVRTHMDNDYVLTNVKMAQGSTTSGLGLATMYEIKGLDSQLKAHLNHQIEVTGTLESGARTPAAGSTSDLADLNGTSVKMLAATCSTPQ